LFGNSEERSILSEGIAYGYEKKAITGRNWKLIHSEGDHVNRLFDLSRDPKAKHDLEAKNSKELQKLKATLPKTEE
jgi:hypothetical protein